MTDDESQDFLRAIRDAGLRQQDFKVKETDLTDFGESSAAVVPIRGEIEITYISTGITKTYNSGHLSSWPAEFHSDLQKGLYGQR